MSGDPFDDWLTSEPEEWPRINWCDLHGTFTANCPCADDAADRQHDDAVNKKHGMD